MRTQFWLRAAASQTLLGLARSRVPKQVLTASLGSRPVMRSCDQQGRSRLHTTRALGGYARRDSRFTRLSSRSSRPVATIGRSERLAVRRGKGALRHSGIVNLERALWSFHPLQPKDPEVLQRHSWSQVRLDQGRSCLAAQDLPWVSGTEETLDDEQRRGGVFFADGPHICRMERDRRRLRVGLPARRGGQPAVRVDGPQQRLSRRVEDDRDVVAIRLH